MSRIQFWMMRRAVDWYVARRGAPRPLPAETRPRRILAFSTTAFGDLLLSTPALGTLRAAFPSARIGVVARYAYLPLVAGLDCVDEWFGYDGGYRRFWRTVRLLRRFRPDVVLILHANGPQDIPLAVLSGARWVLKQDTVSPFARLLSARIASTERHIVERRLDIVRALGADNVRTRMSLPARYRREPPNAERLPSSRAARVAFQVGASLPFRVWPESSFVELGRRLLRNGDLEIVLTGVASERPAAARIAKGLADHESRVLNACGDYTIERLPWLIRQCDVLVTGDTGTLHLAVALGVPTVSLFGASDSRNSGPYQDLERHIVLQIPEGWRIDAEVPRSKRLNRAMAMLGVDDVERAVLRALLAHRSAVPC